MKLLFYCYFVSRLNCVLREKEAETRVWPLCNYLTRVPFFTTHSPCSLSNSSRTLKYTNKERHTSMTLECPKSEYLSSLEQNYVTISDSSIFTLYDNTNELELRNDLDYSEDDEPKEESSSNKDSSFEPMALPKLFLQVGDLQFFGFDSTDFLYLNGSIVRFTETTERLYNLLDVIQALFYRAIEQRRLNRIECSVILKTWKLRGGFVGTVIRHVMYISKECLQSTLNSITRKPKLNILLPI